MLPNFKKNEAEIPKPPAPPAQASMQSSAPAARPGDRMPPSVIGPDLTITGNLSSEGQVQIDGRVEGDIRGTHIIIGERAHITGGIVAEEVVVRGHVMGSVRGKRVMLQAQSHVEGDIYHKALAIEQGAFFEGKSRRSDDPVAAAAPAEKPPMLAPIADAS
ncbi:MAG: polymer-forming cytoskeletal protein [Alphaproteobacteria bacterium]|nr:polymer-forming cytoskeletal protein [Alphaproteobacteria bacterium]